MMLVVAVVGLMMRSVIMMMRLVIIMQKTVRGGMVGVVVSVVRVVVVVVVRMIGVRVAVRVSVRTIAASTVLKNEYADQIHDQTKHRNDEQSIVFHFGRLHHSLDGLGEDEEGNKQKKQSVHEAGQHLGPHIAVRGIREKNG